MQQMFSCSFPAGRRSSQVNERDCIDFWTVNLIPLPTTSIIYKSYLQFQDQTTKELKLNFIIKKNHCPYNTNVFIDSVVFSHWMFLKYKKYVKMTKFYIS